VTACLRRRDGRGRVTTEVRTFATTTAALLTLADWLAAAGCTPAARESTGVYWRPVFNLLEGVVPSLLLVNAQHVKHVPGRKTDVKDAEWLAELLQHGLLRPSFVPGPDQRDLRELTRYRKVLVQQRADECNRIQKLLEAGNIKLASVATDVLGASGRALLEAIADGADDPARLAEWARGRLRAKIPQLAEALRGLVRDHHRWLLRTQLDPIAHLDATIARLDEQIGRRAGVRPPPGRADRAPRHDPGGEPAPRRGARRGGRDGHGPLPRRGPPGEWGGDVPGQPRQRRPEPGRTDPAGQPVAEGGAGRGGMGGVAHPGDVPLGAVPPGRPAPGQEARERGRRACHPAGGVLPALRPGPRIP
jgi:hypothetical protein